MYFPRLSRFSFRLFFFLQTVAVSRLDKEFVGPFGLLLPDVTQLPATFDVLLANLQVSWSPSAAPASIYQLPAPCSWKPNAEAAILAGVVLLLSK